MRWSCNMYSIANLRQKREYLKLIHTGILSNNTNKKSEGSRPHSSGIDYFLSSTSASFTSPSADFDASSAVVLASPSAPSAFLAASLASAS